MEILSGDINVLILENQKTTLKLLQDLGRELNKESYENRRWPRLCVTVVKTDKPSSEYNKQRYDVVVSDIVMTETDHKIINKWVLEWSKNPYKKRMLDVTPITTNNTLTGLKTLIEASKQGKTVAAFSKAGFTELIKYAIDKTERGLWWQLKPEPITRRVIADKGIISPDQLEKLINDSEKAVERDWDSAKAGLVHMIDKAAFEVINNQLRAFWPANLELGLEKRTLRTQQVPIGSFAFLVDMSGSTERLGSEKIEQYWNRVGKLFSQIYKLVMDNQGWVEGFLGDGILAHFGTYSAIEPLSTKRNASYIFRKHVIPFMKEMFKLRLPKNVKDLRIIGTFLPNIRSFTAMVGYMGDQPKDRNRLSLATLSDNLNTCAHIERNIFKDVFFKKRKIKLAFVNPSDSPVGNNAKTLLRKEVGVREMREEETEKILKGKPLRYATIYLLKRDRKS